MTGAEANASGSKDSADTEDQINEAVDLAVELKMWPRIAASVVSLSSLIAGGIAVFTTENQAGTAVLFAGGLFGGIIALGGRLPTSIKLGDNEMKLAQARLLNATSKKIENATPEEASDIIASVSNATAFPLSNNDADARQQEIARRIARMQIVNDNYERLVYTTLSGWARNKNAEIQIEYKGFDIALFANKRTAIEAAVKVSPAQLSVIDVDRFARKVAQAQGEFDHFILISNVDIDLTGHDYWSSIAVLNGPNVHFIAADKHTEMVNRLIPAIEEIEVIN